MRIIISIEPQPLDIGGGGSLEGHMQILVPSPYPVLSIPIPIQSSSPFLKKKSLFFPFPEDLLLFWNTCAHFFSFGRFSLL